MDNNFNALIKHNNQDYECIADTFIPDIYIRNLYFRWSLIRPYITYLVNTDDSMIRGVSISTHFSPEKELIKALNNCEDDKVTLCKGQDIYISDEEWPSKTLPKSICFDMSPPFRSKILLNKLKRLGVIPYLKPYSTSLYNCERSTNNFIKSLKQIIFQDHSKALTNGQKLIVGNNEMLRAVYKAVAYYNKNFCNRIR